MIQAGFTFALHEAVRRISAPQWSGQFLHINKSVEPTFPEEITQTTSITFNHHVLPFISLWSHTHTHTHSGPCWQNYVPATDYYYPINGWNEWRNGMSMTMSLGEGASGHCNGINSERWDTDLYTVPDSESTSALVSHIWPSSARTRCCRFCCQSRKPGKEGWVYCTLWNSVLSFKGERDVLSCLGYKVVNKHICRQGTLRLMVFIIRGSLDLNIEPVTKIITMTTCQCDDH